MALLFNMLLRFVIAFDFVAAVTVHSEFEVQENKIYHRFHDFPIYLLWNDGTRCHDLSFLNIESQASFFTLLSPSSKGSLAPLHLCYLNGINWTSEVVDISPTNKGVNSSRIYVNHKYVYTEHILMMKVIGNRTVIIVDFNNPISRVNTSEQRVNEMRNLNNTVDQIDHTDV